MEQFAGHALVIAIGVLAQSVSPALPKYLDIAVLAEHQGDNQPDVGGAHLTVGAVVVNEKTHAFWAFRAFIDRLACTVTLRLGEIPLPPTVITEDIDQAAAAVERFGTAVLKPLYTSKARGMRRARVSCSA